jgi:hypothetical protein
MNTRKKSLNYKLYAAGTCFKCGWYVSVLNSKFLLPIIKFINNTDYLFFCPTCNKNYISNLDSSKWLFIFHNDKYKFRIDIHLNKIKNLPTEQFVCNTIPFNDLSSEEYLEKIAKLEKLTAFI